MCEKHKKYKALRTPRTGCETCWQVYREAHPERVKPATVAVEPQAEPTAEPAE